MCEEGVGGGAEFWCWEVFECIAEMSHTHNPRMVRNHPGNAGSDQFAIQSRSTHACKLAECPKFGSIVGRRWLPAPAEPELIFPRQTQQKMPQDLMVFQEKWRAIGPLSKGFKPSIAYQDISKR